MTSSPDRPGAAWLPDLDETGVARAVAEEGAWRPPPLGDGGRVGSRVGLHNRLEEAYERGHATGVKEGEDRAMRDLAPVMAALQAVVRDLADAKGRFEADRGANLSALALAVARQLLMREVGTDPTVVRDLIAQALDQLPPNDIVDVRLSPVDLSALAGSLEELHAAGRGLTLQWIADPEMERGSFLLETPARLVDGRTDIALRTLYDRLAHD
jgi:flagellar assembly protein FliH